MGMYVSQYLSALTHHQPRKCFNPNQMTRKTIFSLWTRLRLWNYRRTVKRDIERQAKADPEFINDLSELFGTQELSELKHQSQERDRKIAASENTNKEEFFLIRPEKARSARIKWPRKL